MLKINDLAQINNEIIEQFENSLKKIPALSEGKYRFTSEICFMYMNNTEFIKDSILDLVERQNYYSVNILYRSLLEHFLRFNYFFFNFAIFGKNDNYSHKFRTALVFTDKLSLALSNNSIKKIKNEDSKSLKEIQKEIYNNNPEFKKFDFDELINFSSELSIKKIIDYIENYIGNKTPTPNDFLLDKILQYSKQSSYVYGGMFAHQEFMKFASIDEEKKLNMLTTIFGLALQISSFIKMYSYTMLLEADPEFFNYYNEITTKILKLTPNYNYS